MLEKIKKWFGFGKRSAKRVAWNDTFELLAENGVFELKDFTGRLSFDSRTECSVEHATLTVFIGNAGYLDGTVKLRAPWSRGVNRIVWHDGTVTGGDLCSWGFEKGEFNGGKLLIVKDSMKGVFHGNELHEHLPF